MPSATGHASHKMDEVSRTVLSRPTCVAALSGLVVAFLLLLTYKVSANYGLKESRLDDICGGIIVGLLVYRYERNRSKYLTDKLNSVRLMNHHVRNALNIIMMSTYVQGHSEESNAIQTSINRIDWALREILPGRISDDYDDAALEKQSQKRSAWT